VNFLKLLGFSGIHFDDDDDDDDDELVLVISILDVGRNWMLLFFVKKEMGCVFTNREWE
jgi:hypothetical protein